MRNRRKKCVLRYSRAMRVTKILKALWATKWKVRVRDKSRKGLCRMGGSTSCFLIENEIWVPQAKSRLASGANLEQEGEHWSAEDLIGLITDPMDR
jgi:hypothetical protein